MSSASPQKPGQAVQPLGFRPECVPVPDAARYPQKAVRAVRLDGRTLLIDIQGEGFSYARLVFSNVYGVRILDERDLLEFWNAHSEPNGWLWEVKSGGWLELERRRAGFNSHEFAPGLREFFVVDDMCMSVLCCEPPELLDLGADPPAAAPPASKDL